MELRTSIDDESNQNLRKDSRIERFYQLSDREITRYKNIYAIQELVPLALRRFLIWGTFNKPENISFYDYLREYRNISPRQLKKKYKFINRYVETIKNDGDINEYDSSLLCSLIQACCDGLEDPNHAFWDDATDESRAECLLTSIKNLRNFIVHGSLATDPDAFEKLIEKMKKLIRICAHMYKKSDADFQQGIMEVDEHLNVIMNRIACSYDVRSLTQFQREALEESRDYWFRSFEKDTAGMNHVNVKMMMLYYPLGIKPLYHSHLKEIANKSELNSEALLEQWNDHDVARITIIIGEAGAGKSTVLRNIGFTYFHSDESTGKYLQKFQILYYFQCRDRACPSFVEFIRSHFPDTCKNCQTSDIVSCFKNSVNLILVDGFDERNDGSTQTFREILNNFQSSVGSHMIISTRPHSVGDLSRMLTDSGLQHRMAKLVEISQLVDQCSFLRQCGEAMGAKSKGDEIVSAFYKLNDSTRQFFTNPFSLVTFADVALQSTQRFSDLNDPNDVLCYILDRYQKNLEDKWNNYGINNLHLLIQDVLCDLGNFAFICLDQNKMVVSEADLEEITNSNLKKTLRQYGALHLVDVKHIFSTFLQSRNMPSPDNNLTYQFQHKSVQELMAAKALVSNLREFHAKPGENFLEKIRGGHENIRRTHLQRYLNVLKFAMIELLKPKPQNDLTDYQRRSIDSLVELIQDADPEFTYWADLIASCDNSPVLVRAFAEEDDHENDLLQFGKVLTNVKEEVWEVRNERIVLSTVDMLCNKQPNRLVIDFPASMSTPGGLIELLKVVKEKFTGDLELNLRRSSALMDPCDDFIRPLEGARCDLKEFIGFLSDSNIVYTCLVPLFKRIGNFTSNVRLRLPLPITTDHNLRQLRQSAHFLYVTVEYSSEVPAIEDSSTHPVPKFPLPERGRLNIVGVPAGAPIDRLLTIIKIYAPQSLRFWELTLHRCSLDDDHLTLLLQKMFEAGIRTPKVRGTTRFIDHSSPYKGTNRKISCIDCVEPHDQSERNIELILD